MSNGQMSRGERRELQRVARRLLRRAPRPEVGEDWAQYMARQERWEQDVDNRAREGGLDIDALWECLDRMAAEQTNSMVSPAGIVEAEAAGLVPPADFTIPAARAIFDAGHRDPSIFQIITRRYLEISRQRDRQPVVRWAVGGRYVLAHRRPGRVQVDLWLEGEREEPAEVDDGGLPSSEEARTHTGRLGEAGDDPNLALAGELDEGVVASQNATGEEKGRALAAMPRRRAYTDPQVWWTDVWGWQWGMELAYAEDWQLLSRVGEAIYEEAGTENPLAPAEPDPRKVAEFEEYLSRKAPPGYARGLLDAGLNCTLRASMVMQNDGARAENASGLFDAYVRLCREREERVFAAFDMSTGQGEWLLCAWRVPGEGRVTVGLSDELAPTDDVHVAHAGHLREVFRP